MPSMTPCSAERIKAILSEWVEISGRDHGGLIEAYRTKDAEIVLMAMGSVAGTAKEAVDNLRTTGKKVGLVKIRCYRPFPYEDILKAIQEAKVIAVMDANFSMGNEGAVGLDLKAKPYGRSNAPVVVDIIAGLGGRVINQGTIRKIVELAEKACESEISPSEPYWMDLNPEILS